MVEIVDVHQRRRTLRRDRYRIAVRIPHAFPPNNGILRDRLGVKDIPGRTITLKRPVLAINSIRGADTGLRGHRQYFDPYSVGQIEPCRPLGQIETDHQ